MEIYYRPEKYGDIGWDIVYSKQMDSPNGAPRHHYPNCQASGALVGIRLRQIRVEI